ncbi:serine/threonine protein kinase [Candidatus Bathyarchaeota archaeon]|nr:serine/threonine protein kinase [Candidatus Bathyarchaeota archaeon]
MSDFVKIENLYGTKVGDYVCYPRCSTDEMEERIAQLKALGVKSVSLGGPHNIMGYNVLGKGHVGVVLNAVSKKDIIALKARRTDADRDNMTHEAAMLQIANGVDVGPKIMGFTRDFIVMEKLEGPYFGAWVRTYEGSNEEFLKMVREILWKAFKLDQVGLDHGELSKVRRHIIVHEGEPRLIDFESASTDRKVQNVTSTVQSMFLNHRFARVMEDWTDIPENSILIDYLRDYKKNRSEANFFKILKLLGLV